MEFSHEIFVVGLILSVLYVIVLILAPEQLGALNILALLG
jgi:hypothetical protein